MPARAAAVGGAQARGVPAAMFEMVMAGAYAIVRGHPPHVGAAVACRTAQVTLDYLSTRSTTQDTHNSGPPVQFRTPNHSRSRMCGSCGRSI
jgi:hypothetical protein